MEMSALRVPVEHHAYNPNCHQKSEAGNQPIQVRHARPCAASQQGRFPRAAFFAAKVEDGNSTKANDMSHIVPEERRKEKATHSR